MPFRPFSGCGARAEWRAGGFFVRPEPDKSALCPYIDGMIGARNILHIGRSVLLALLLLVVGAHAASPLGQPLERGAGSAFSAATADVALKSGSLLVIAKRIAPVIPPLPPVAIAIARAPVTHAMPSQRHGLAAQTGPPAAETSFSPLAPRAPPAA